MRLHDNLTVIVLCILVLKGEGTTKQSGCKFSEE